MDNIPQDVIGIIPGFLGWSDLFAFALVCKRFSRGIREFRKTGLNRYISRLSDDDIIQFPRVNWLCMSAMESGNHQLLSRILKYRNFTDPKITYNVLLTFGDNADSMTRKYSSNSAANHEIILYCCFAGTCGIIWDRIYNYKHNFVYDGSYLHILCIDRPIKDEYYSHLQKTFSGKAGEILFLLNLFTETLWKSDNIAEKMKKIVEKIIQCDFPNFIKANRLSRVIFLSSNTDCAGYVVDAIADKISEDSSGNWSKIAEETMKLIILRYLPVLRERKKSQLIRKLLSIVIKSDNLTAIYATYIDKETAEDEIDAITAAYNLGGCVRENVSEKLGGKLDLLMQKNITD